MVYQSRTQSEAQLENEMIEQLVQLGYAKVSIPSIKNLQENFRIQMDRLNKENLNGTPLSDKEFDGENKYIRITDIDESSRRYIEEGKVSPLGKLSEEYRIRQGDILFARTGASTGKSYLYRESDGKIYYAGFLIRLRVKEGVDSRFVYYQTLLKEYDQWVKVMSMRSGQPGINAQEYSSYEFGLPSIDEQIRISDFLDGIENKIEKEREKLMVLEEQKKGFMRRMFV